MAISIVAVAALLSGACLYVLFALRAILFVRKRANYPIALPVILLVLIGLPVWLLFQIQHTPPANAISDTVHVNDASRQLTIHSIAMAAPSYEEGAGHLEKHYKSEVTVDVENSAEETLYLGLEYYSSSGSLGYYSPGGTFGREWLSVPPRWSGPLTFPVRYLRFLRGGSIRLTLYRCSGPNNEGKFEPSTRLFEKSYEMVAGG